MENIQILNIQIFEYLSFHSHAYLLAKFGFDTAENEPFQVCPLSAYRSPRLTQDATYCYIKRLAAVVRNATAYELPSPDALIEYGFQQSPAQAQKRWRAR